MFSIEVCSHILKIIEKTNITRFSSVAIVWWCSRKKLFQNLTQNYLRRSLIKLPVSRLRIENTQVFSYEFCEVFKNTFLVEHLRTAVS